MLRAMFVPAVTAAAPRGRLYVVTGQALCVVRDERGPAIPVGPVGEADAAWLVIGMLGAEACFARALAVDEPPPPGTEPVPLRQLFGALPDDDFGIASRALGLTAWDHDHRHCGRCGGETVRSAHERVRTCTRCGHGAYPRLSPAVIGLVERDGCALLARNARVALGFHSCLAGFVEVGESLEEALAREVEEEAGVAITDIRYFGSQPWPLTGSLMIGFTARWAGGELRPDPTEIVDAGWFRADALPPVPPPFSIARALIDDFVRRHA